MLKLLKAPFTNLKNKQFIKTNKIPNELQSKVIAFLNAVDTHFSFLSDYGYTVKQERLATQYVVDNIIEVSYKNEDFDRIIRIQYEPKDLDNKDVDFISVSIFEVIRFLNKEIKFALYIKKYKPDFDIEHLSYCNKNKQASFEENIHTAIAGFAYLLKDIGINLVNCSEWEDGLTFDWSSAEKMLYEAQKKIIYGDNKDTKEE